MKKLSGKLLFRLSMIVFFTIFFTIGFITCSAVVLLKIFKFTFADNIDINGVKVSIISFLLTIIVLCMIISFFIAIFFLKNYLKPVNDLKVAMNKVSKGEFEYLEELKETREINELIVSYNKMVKEIQHMGTISEEYTANISHEFKTPLATIKGYLDLLVLGDNTKEEQEEYLMMIRNANERLLALTNNILLLNKVDNREIVKISPFALDNQIREAIIMLENKWKEKNIEINIELDEFLIESNEEMLMSVWTNILSNSIKFTEDKGHINVKLVSHGEYAEVTIDDDGIGIAQEDLEKIFDRFYQVDNSHKVEGNGLGLALVKKIIDKTKGSISVYSEIDTGTTFVIKLNKKSY